MENVERIILSRSSCCVYIYIYTRQIPQRGKVFGRLKSSLPLTGDYRYLREHWYMNNRFDKTVYTGWPTGKIIGRRIQYTPKRFSRYWNTLSLPRLSYRFRTEYFIRD